MRISAVVLCLTSLFLFSLTGCDQATDPAPVKEIDITSPTAGQVFHVGQPITVTWTAVPEKLSSLRVMLSTDDGKSYDDVRSSSCDPKDGSYTWTLGAEESLLEFSYPSTKCIIKLRDYNNGALFDVSETFSIQP